MQWNRFDMDKTKAMPNSSSSPKFPGVALTLRDLQETVTTCTKGIPPDRPVTITAGVGRVPRVTPELFCSVPTLVSVALQKRARRQKRKRDPSAERGVSGKHSVKAITPGPRSTQELAAAVFLVATQSIRPSVIP